MQLEDKHAKTIAAALKDQLAEVLPSDTTSDSVFGWEQRLERTAQSMRDTLYGMLLEGARLGVDVGEQQLHQVLGTSTKSTDDPSGDVAAMVSLVDWDLVNEDAAAWARDHAGELIYGLNNTTSTILRTAIAEWISNERTLKELYAELHPIFGKARARRIAVTEITGAYAQGNIAAWKRSGVITTMEWQTANDERVCPSCGPMQGVQLPVDGGDAPPLHVSCRCWLVPVVEEPKR